MLRTGIVGLPNVGKSTLFNAVTRTRKAEAANYPFCTIDPNLGIVEVPDARLEVVAGIAKSAKAVPTVIEFVDIAGLVKGASRGEGLGNQFLSHIREVDAIVQVVRCFESGDVHHVDGSIDPVRDIEVVNTELELADYAGLKRRREKLAKQVKGGDKDGKRLLDLIERLLPHLDEGRPAITLETTQEVLHDLLRANDRRVTIEEIQKRVAEHFNVRVADMHSARRARAVARPRQVAMYLSKQLTTRSLPEIGRKFGGRDHTTVMHAVRRIEELKATDNGFAEDVELLRRMLEG